MLTTDELIASAKGCGLQYEGYSGGKILVYFDDGSYEWWSPPENAEQDRMCLKELLRQERYSVSYEASGGHRLIDYHSGSPLLTFFDCPAEEFAAKALAKVVADG